MDNELQKCKESFVYFAKKYIKIKMPDGSERKLNDVELEMLKLLEAAQKEGGQLKHIWMRGKYHWIIVKD